MSEGVKLNQVPDQENGKSPISASKFRTWEQVRMKMPKSMASNVSTKKGSRIDDRAFKVKERTSNFPTEESHHYARNAQLPLAALKYTDTHY
jgi:hypothetical protein